MRIEKIHNGSGWGFGLSEQGGVFLWEFLTLGSFLVDPHV